MDNDFMTDIDLTKVQSMFREESYQLLKDAEKALLDLEKAPDDTDLIGIIFRCAHSIKGGASVCGYDRIVEFIHGFEELLDMVRKGRLAVTKDHINFALRVIDALNDLLRMTESCEPELEESHLELLKILPELSTPYKSGDPLDVPDAYPAATAVKNRESIPEHSSLGQAARTIRVPVERLDELMNLVGEISIARGRITDMLESQGDDESGHLLEIHRESNYLYMELQELAMKMRTVPINPLFEEFYRTVRDLSLSCGKKVQLVTSGGGAEVDTTVVEHLRGPIIHMVRNAIYHGIETPDKRLHQRKNPVGTITLSASQEAGRIRVVVEDDGTGLDRDRIYHTAVKNGFIQSGQELRDSELFQMILKPGFSTAEQKNEISGRGVGMDVVQRNLELLRGRIQVESKAGQGSRFILTMPLTLAIIDGFRVAVGKELYVIPLESVRECIELPAEDKEKSAKFGVTKLRGKPLPFLYLKRIFDLESSPYARENLIVIGYGDKQAGIVVDRLLGEAQTVIKPLGKLFQDINGIMGSTIMGNGRVAFVLDVASIVTSAIEEMENMAAMKKEGHENQENSSAPIFMG